MIESGSHSASTRWKHIAQIGPTYRDYNGTDSNASATFTSSYIGTVTVSASGGGNLDLSAIVAGVQVNLGLSVSFSMTAYQGDAITITVPPHRAGYGDYGVWRVVTFGHFYHVNQQCKIDVDEGTVEGWSPFYVGWNTWIGY